MARKKGYGTRLEDALQEGARRDLVVIVGRGVHSAAQPLLRPAVEAWLHTHAVAHTAEASGGALRISAAAIAALRARVRAR